MKRLDFFWQSNKEWWEYNENLFPVLTDKAPPEAKASYDRYMEQVQSSAL